MLAIYLNICNVVFEDSGDVDLEQASQPMPLSTNTIFLTLLSDGDDGCDVSDDGNGKEVLGSGLRKSMGGGCSHTSGNVPLENTL